MADKEEIKTLEELEEKGRILREYKEKFRQMCQENKIKSVYLIATRDLSNLWLQFFLSQNQGFMRLFEKTVLK